MDECECDEHEHMHCQCPMCKFFAHFEHGHHGEPPEFVDHFMTAHKEVLLGLREMIDWKIDKLEKRRKRMTKRRVKKVEIE